MVSNAGESAVNGVYAPRSSASVPQGFADTCKANSWEPDATWRKLSDAGRTWFESANGSYFYWNRGDGHWWLDGPSGAGLYIARDDGPRPPESGWTGVTGRVRAPMPVVRNLPQDRE